MKAFLNSPAPFPDKRSILYETLFLSAYSLLVLFIFQPFGTYEYEHPLKWIQLFGYIGIVGLAYPLVKKVLLRFKSGRYQIKDEIRILFLAFLVITLAGFFYHGWAFYGKVLWTNFLFFMRLCFAFFLLPFFVLLYRARVKSQKINSDGTTGDGRKLEIKGNNQREHFRFNASDVIYLKSNGNYVMVYFEKDGAVKHEMVRNTLQEVSRQLSDADFSAIHRSFFVNPKKFDRILNEDGKHVLINRKFDIRVPVSRQNVRAIDLKLKDHS